MSGPLLHKKWFKLSITILNRSIQEFPALLIFPIVKQSQKKSLPPNPNKYVLLITIKCHVYLNIGTWYLLHQVYLGKKSNRSRNI